MEPAAISDETSARLEYIRQTILNRFKKDKSPKIVLLGKAIKDAEFFHRNQFRKSGEPAIIHPYRVALLVSEAGMDVEAVIIALLHDVIEDTEVTKDEMGKKYGAWLAEVVDGLTKVVTPKGEDQTNPASIETYRKLLTSTVKDLRTLQVKIFDRLDNMRDLGFLRRIRQRAISMETMIVYVPMAQRLGMQDISNELSTLSFRYLYPKRFEKILGLLQNRIKEERKRGKGIKKMLEKAFKGLEGDFNIEPKYYQVWDYFYSRDLKVEKVLMGFTISTPSAESCYTILGSLHKEYRVVPNSIKDFISNPKPNRHQALESKIFIAKEPVAIEIFSYEMEKVNRMGILADWRTSREEISKYYQSYLELLDQFAGNEDLRMEDVLRHGQMDSLQIFTPVGEIMTFPQKATLLDFAFAIHTDLGIHCDGGWVDGRRAPRFEELRDGSMVEIITSPKVKPNARWLANARTTRAKLAIRRYIRSKRMDRAEEVGNRLFMADLKRLEIDPESFLLKDEFKKALKKEKRSEKNFFQQVGMRKLNIREFLLENKLVAEKSLGKLGSQGSQSSLGILQYLTPRFKTPDPDLRISEIGDEFMHLAPCCSPLIGDAIKGMQQENGIIIHRVECKVLEKARSELLVSVGWEKSSHKVPHRLNLTVQDSPGQIYKIGKIMRDLKVNIHDLSVRREVESERAIIRLLIEPVKSDKYKKVISRLRSIKEILKIT